MSNHQQNQGLPRNDVAGQRETDGGLNKANQEETQGGDEQEFPGYPHYPPSEDIMNPANHIVRIPVDVENLAPTGALNHPPRNPGTSTDDVPFVAALNTPDDEIRIVTGTEADVTKEDLRVLNALDGAYAPASSSATVTGEDLDVPGADIDDPSEEIGEEDEENNYYSLGGDNHENLEEDPS